MSGGQLPAHDCLHGLKEALVSGGFSGSVDCQSDKLSIRKIGSLRTQRHEYFIYDYKYRLADTCKDCAIHGGQRVLIFFRGHYIGQYKPDGVNLMIKDNRLFLSSLNEAAAHQGFTEIRISERGFPRKILIDGEFFEFFR
ncbi:hypothetical protein [Novosphingobium clariflavum]|uniref:Uncharacterized protein n=1 Tax=Novosphingobium clariflavum TaxID=2029884 RepID=A0ABV6SBY2_9SPHN|nr:hypothetical protein [Novosphingobium clariflavum]